MRCNQSGFSACFDEGHQEKSKIIKRTYIHVKLQSIMLISAPFPNRRSCIIVLYLDETRVVTWLVLLSCTSLKILINGLSIAFSHCFPDYLC